MMGYLLGSPWLMFLPNFLTIALPEHTRHEDPLGGSQETPRRLVDVHADRKLVLVFATTKQPSITYPHG
jgi:hypothetical protein